MNREPKTFFRLWNVVHMYSHTSKNVFFYLYQSRQLESETGTTEEHSLNKEARKWATRVAREHKNIIHYKRVRRKHSSISSHVDVIFIYRLFLIRPTFVVFPVFGRVRQSWLTAHGAGQAGPGAEDRRHQRKHAQGRGLYVTDPIPA